MTLNNSIPKRSTHIEQKIIKELKQKYPKMECSVYGNEVTITIHDCGHIDVGDFNKLIKQFNMYFECIEFGENPQTLHWDSFILGFEIMSKIKKGN